MHKNQPSDLINRLTNIKNPELNRSKSEKKLGSAQKRLRLRDYMFVASTNLMRKGQKKQSLKRQLSERSQLKESLSVLKKERFKLQNTEIYLILKNQVVKSLQAIIQDLKCKSEAIEKKTVANPSNQDLHYLYDIKRTISNYLYPAIKQMEDLSFQKNTNIIKQIINIGLCSVNNQIKQEDIEESFINTNIIEPKQ